MTEQEQHHVCIADRIRHHLESCGPNIINSAYNPSNYSYEYNLSVMDDKRKQDLLNVSLLIYNQIRGEESYSNYGGYSPRTLAAAIFYCAIVITNTRSGMTEVGAVFDVSPSTISKHFHRLKRIVNLNAEDIQDYLLEHGYPD